MADDGDLQPLLDALKTVAVALKEDGVPFALAGGCAVYARGGQDSRHDVDFVVLQEEADRARRALERRGIATIDPPEDWLFKARHGEAQVDLIFRLATGPVDRDLLQRADELVVDSVAMPVLSATDLLTAKLHALREHHCDLAPVLALIRSLREQLDVERVDAVCAGHPFSDAALLLARRLGLLEPGPASGRSEEGR